MSRSLCDESITHTWRQLKDSIIFREFFNLKQFFGEGFTCETRQWMITA